MNVQPLVRRMRVPLTLLLVALSPSGRANAQSMTMPPSDLCAGGSDSTVVAKGTTLAPSGSPTFGCLSIHGTLDLSNVRSITVRTLHQHAEGLIRVNADGVSREIVIADGAPSDEGRFGTGLVLEGRVELQGTAKTAWTRLTAEVLPGARTIDVADATGWAIGDAIVVADSRDDIRPNLRTPESFIIVSVSGSQITLDHPAAIPHPASRACADASCTSFKLERFAPVGNLSRSFVIRSANPSGNRGHFMLTMGATGFVRNVEIRDMGRTTNEFISPANPKGRYAAHLHFVDRTGFEFVGNAVHRATKWGIVVHHTNGSLVRDNVVFQAMGAGVMTEDGTETDNRFDHNLVIGIGGDGIGAESRAHVQEFGTGGVGFWFQGPRNKVTNNVSADTLQQGYILWGRDNPNEPLREFRDNEALAAAIGVEVWFLGSYSADSVIDHFYEWHSSTAFYGYPSVRVVIQDFTSRGDPANLTADSFKTGLSFGDYSAPGARLVRPDVQHKSYGIWVPYGNASGGPGGERLFSIVGGQFLHNVWAVVSMTPVGSYPPSSQLPFHTVMTGVRLSANQKADIRRWFVPSQGSNLISSDTFDVYDHQGVAGDNYRVFYTQSAPDFVMPSGSWLGSLYADGPNYTGLSNQEMWDRHKSAIAGAVAPCTTTRPEVVGFVCPLTQPPPQAVSLPSAPRNVRLVSN